MRKIDWSNGIPVRYFPQREVINTEIKGNDWRSRQEAAETLGCCSEMFWFESILEICTRSKGHNGECGPLGIERNSEVGRTLA